MDAHGPAFAAEKVATADLQYLLPAMRRAVDRYLVLQYCSLVGYETRRFWRLQLGRPLKTPESAGSIAAARHSVKYLGDERRTIDGVVSQFGSLITANRLAFFPHDRPMPEYDFLRSDLSVVTVAGIPLLSSLSSYFGLGLGTRPNLTAGFGQVGPVAEALGWEIGDLARELLPPVQRHHRGPRPIDTTQVVWLDGDSSQAYPSMFAGTLANAEAGILSAIMLGLTAANMFAHSDCCRDCEGAAFKQRLTVTWHACASLHRLIDGPVTVAPLGRATLQRLVASPVVQVLERPEIRQLRNGLVHLGLSDLPDEVFAQGVGVHELTKAYTSQEFELVEQQVDAALTFLSDALQIWSLQPPVGAPPYIDGFTNADVDGDDD